MDQTSGPLGPEFIVAGADPISERRKTAGRP